MTTAVVVPDEKVSTDETFSKPHLFCPRCKRLLGAQRGEPGVFEALCGELAPSNGQKLQESLFAYCERCVRVAVTSCPKCGNRGLV